MALSLAVVLNKSLYPYFDLTNSPFDRPNESNCVMIESTLDVLIEGNLCISKCLVVGDSEIEVIFGKLYNFKYSIE